MDTLESHLPNRAFPAVGCHIVRETAKVGVECDTRLVLPPVYCFISGAPVVVGIAVEVEIETTAGANIDQGQRRRGFPVDKREDRQETGAVNYAFTMNLNGCSTSSEYASSAPIPRFAPVTSAFLPYKP